MLTSLPFHPHNKHTMHRFFLREDSFAGEAVSIRGEQARQIAAVLRLKPGDRITVLDNTGFEYEVELSRVTPVLVENRVVGKKPGEGEPSTSVTLYQALIKADKFELVLQKGVELGVRHFSPFIAERCVAREPSHSRIQRWRAIIREASEQSRRARLPDLHSVVTFKEACGHIEFPAIILWEGERVSSLAGVLKSAQFRKAQAMSIFVGPEGGFSPAEIDLAREHGIIPVSLGKRILRTETAGLVAISAIMYERGEMG